MSKIFNDEVGVSLSSIRAEVKQRNAFRAILDKCLYTFNSLPIQRLDGEFEHKNTYELAVEVEKVLHENI